MPSNLVPQLSLGTAALLIFLVCVGIVMLRGMTRAILGCMVLLPSAWMAFMAWQRAPALSVEWTGKSQTWITTGLPIVLFLCFYYLIRKLLKAIVSPFGKNQDNGEKSSGSVIGLVFKFLLALIPAALICVVALAFAHHTGSVAELRSFSQKSQGINAPDSIKFSEKLKSSIESIVPASWLKLLDPLADPSRLALAKVITAQSESSLKPVINPKTGKPFPRAIIVQDPELQDCARQGNFGTLLRHPLLTKALADPKIKALLKDLQM